MQLDNPLIKVPAKFGAFGALIVLIMFFLLYFTGANPLTEMDMFDFFILPIFLFFGIKEFRDSHNHRFIEFWQGMTVGFILYSTLALLTTLVLSIFLNLADQQVFDDYVRDVVEEVTNSKEQTVDKMGSEAYEEALHKVEQTTQIDLIVDYLMKKLIIGLMLTIMIAVIMRRTEKPEENNDSK